VVVADSGKGAGRRSKITPFHDQVGSISDKEVAGLAGVSTEAVRMYRRRRGIDLQIEKVAGPKKSRKASRRRSRLDPFFDELGQVPDAEIAAKAGVTPENVRAFRSRHGILAEYRRTRRKAKKEVATAVPEAAAAAAEAPVASRMVDVLEAAPAVRADRTASSSVVASIAESAAQAYAIQIVGLDDTWVLFADDVAKAAMRAMGSMESIAPGGRIGSITHLGRALV
jgi:hypothetical protein